MNIDGVSSILFETYIQVPKERKRIIKVKSIIEDRLNKMLKNQNDERLTLEDAKFFMKIKGQINQLPVEDLGREHYERIRENYMWRHPILPILAGKDRVAIIVLK